MNRAPNPQIPSLRKLPVVLGMAALAMLISALPAGASHSWGGYHWARTINPFAIKLGDNVASNWDSYLTTASADWSQSSVLDTVVDRGQARGNCLATRGRVEVCNRAYGNNGWLGLAQIWVSGAHIVQGTAKMNDTYFNTSSYNTAEWRQIVMCQEVGHTFGLDHQDNTFDNANLGSCMDYTSDPSTNQHPNAHDYAQLESIYTHLDNTTTVGATTGQGLPAAANGNFDTPGEWGRLVRESNDGRIAVYERDLGGGNKVLTYVIWAEPRGASPR